MTKREAKRQRRIAKVLRDAAKIIANKQRWCQGAWGACVVEKDGRSASIEAPVLTPARADSLSNTDGEFEWVESNSPRAVRWCAEGAIYKAAPRRQLATEALAAVNARLPGDRSLVSLNDRTGDASRKRVRKAMLDTAAKLEREAAA